MPPFSGTARRLLLSSGALVVLLGAAAWFALTGLSRIREVLQRVHEHEQAVRLALDLAVAVRDQYAHQAHTIIIGDDSHLVLYAEARHRVRLLSQELAGQATGAEERMLLEGIRRSAGEMDRIFRETIVPKVIAGATRADVTEEHHALHGYVFDVQERSDRMARRFEDAIARYEAEARGIQSRTQRRTLLLLGGAILFAIAVGLWIGRSVARPVALLAAGADRVGRGDLTTRIVVDDPHEFGRLAAHFNAMTEALRENQERLVQSEKLAGIGRLAAGVAHEINNPLGVILGYVRLLRKKADAQTTDDLAVIEDETLRCQSIVKGLLELARPQAFRPEPVDLRDICDEVVARLDEAQQLSGSSVRVEGRAVAFGHGQKLRQVVLNLVKNAVEASAPEGRVALRLEREGAEVALHVEDSGPGIPAEQRKRLFEPFFTTKRGGTGLGLAVSRAIVQAHGGRIDVGQAPGAGALVTVRLPAADGV